MIKTFIGGIVLGIAGAVAALHFLPAVNIARENSLISVMPNGGNAESFHVNIPADRILLGASGQKNAYPQGMQWPEDALLDGTRSEVFKLRNSQDAVIGVASRVTVQNAKLGNVIEWVLHFPARGSMYVTLAPNVVDNRRTGNMRAGTREFGDLVGTLSERWVAAEKSSDELHAGRIELLASYEATAKASATGEINGGGSE
ncbi:MAG TPA: hypothetical protein PKK10_01475 [Woeseiaceae bacterium]|nr:hypothetical protein [Woeseiaceae bacterium]